jgi:hypothetical protein
LALTKCKECGAKVSTKAVACPTCGARRGGARRLLIRLLASIFSLVVVVAIGSWLLEKTQPSEEELKAELDTRCRSGADAAPEIMKKIFYDNCIKIGTAKLKMQGKIQ